MQSTQLTKTRQCRTGTRRIDNDVCVCCLLRAGVVVSLLPNRWHPLSCHVVQCNCTYRDLGYQVWIHTV